MERGTKEIIQRGLVTLATVPLAISVIIFLVISVAPNRVPQPDIHKKRSPY